MPAPRTRFAPSPTGHLHIGGARTALFNYLFARNQGGVFILRIEDTDRERSTAEFIAGILDALQWLGLAWDEGPFYQSQRSELYREHVERLLAAGHAYRCYCSPAELEARRQAALTAGRKPTYDRTCRTAAPRPAGEPFAVRFAAPVSGETIVSDSIKGAVAFRNEELEDLVIARSDGTPTFNLCNVVDDALMGVTHIIRGEDHLTNSAKQIQLYRAFDYAVPAFTHVPLIHGLSGGRLSKRHGATSVTAYREAGYLPDALVNYLVRLGWSFGDQEIFTRAELIEKFSLDRLGTAAAVFNPEKLEWVNFQHLKRMSHAELAAAVKPFIAARGWSARGDDAWLQRMVATLQERAKTLVELVDLARFYLRDDVEIDPKAVSHLAKADPAALNDLRAELAGLREWTAAAIQGAFESVLSRHHLKLGSLAQPVRVALTGRTVSPGIFEVIEVLGRERVLARLDRALPLTGQATAQPSSGHLR
jgi:glutamyl-tRNA synthetase